MGFTVSPELALGVSATCLTVYSGGMVVARKPFMNMYFSEGTTGSRGTMGDWATLMTAGHVAKDFVAVKEGPTKKHVLCTGAMWVGSLALSAYQTFGPKQSIKKEGFYQMAGVQAVNIGLCFIAAKDM